MARTISLRRRQSAVRSRLCLILSLLATAAQAAPHIVRPPKLIKLKPYPSARQAPIQQNGSPNAIRLLGRPVVSPAEVRSRDLLRQMLQAEKTLALSGDQVTNLSRNGQVITSEQHILRNGSHALRMEYLRPPRFAGEQIVDNGRLFYHYVPATNSLEVGPSRIGNLIDRVPQVLDQIKRNALSVQWIGQDNIAGHACAVIEVAPRATNQSPRRRFWIDPTNGAQLRIDVYDAAGQLASSSYYTTVTYNPLLAPEDFKPPTVPKDVHPVAPEAVGPTLTLPQAQTQAGFLIAQPDYLPAGFRLQSASVQDFRRSKLVALRYVNGLNVLSLFETPLGPNAKPPAGPIRINHPRRGVSILTQNGLRIILVGNLTPDEMDRMVSSLH